MYIRMSLYESNAFEGNVWNQMYRINLHEGNVI